MRKVLILHRFYGKVDMGMKAGCIYKKVHFFVNLEVLYSRFFRRSAAAPAFFEPDVGTRPVCQRLFLFYGSTRDDVSPAAPAAGDAGGGGILCAANLGKRTDANIGAKQRLRGKPMRRTGRAVLQIIGNGGT